MEKVEWWEDYTDKRLNGAVCYDKMIGLGERLLIKTPALEESVSTDEEWKNGLLERKLRWFVRVGDAHSIVKELPFVAFHRFSFNEFWLVLFSVWS